MLALCSLPFIVPSPRTNLVPAWSLAVVAILSVQIGAAISIELFDDIGVAGTAWLRMTIAAIGFVVIARPKYWQWSFRELRAPLLLGLISALMTLLFLAAIDLMPLGTVVAIEFLGPLTIAALFSKNVRALVWPLMALVGVVLLVQPWRGEPNLLGLAFAVLSAVCWGLYIIVTQHVGDRFEGVDGLAISLPVAALVTAGIGVPQAWGHLTWEILGVGLIAAILLPLIPWTLELMALRRLTKSAFGTLMAIEPAVALVIGTVLLHQELGVMQILGIALVVVAGVAAARTGDRADEIPNLTTPIE